MKSLSSLVSVMIAVAGVFSAGAQKIVENPDYECKKSGVINVERIVTDGDTTRVDFILKAKPGYKGTVEKNTRLRDNASGVEYLPVRAEGVELGGGIKTGKDSIARYSLFYDALPPSVEKVDMLEGGWDIFGIHLDGKPARKPARVKNPDSLIPVKEHPAAPAPVFSSGTVVISGVIDGYDPRVNGDMIHASVRNCVGQRSLTVNIGINPDGTFSEKLYLVSSGEVTLDINGYGLLPVYVEAGEDLFIYFDPEQKMLRQAGLPAGPALCFGGSLGEINHGIVNAPGNPNVYPDRDKTQRENHEKIRRAADKWSERMERYIAANPSMHPIAVSYLRDDVKSFRAHSQLDYMNFGLKSSKEPIDTALALKVFSDVLPDVFAADSLVLTTPWNMRLMNRLAFCQLPEMLGMVEKGVIRPDSAMTKKLFESPDSNRMVNHPVIAGNLADNQEIKQSKTPFRPVSALKHRTENIDQRSKMMMEFAGMSEMPLVLQALGTSALCSYYRSDQLGTYDECEPFIDSMQSVTRPELRDAIKAYYQTLLSGKPSDIPDDAGGRILRRILSPYKGKLVIVDFWEMGCGPCRAEIRDWKEFRDTHRDGKDYMFVFISSDEDSSDEVYESFVAKNLNNDISLRIPQKEFRQIQETLNFNYFPYEIIVDPEGRIAVNNFRLTFPAFFGRTLEKFGIGL